MVSFLSPCVLALVPGYLAFLSGLPVERLAGNRRAVVMPTAAFIGGFTVVFTLLGAGLGGASSILRSQRPTLELAGGAILIVLGLLAVLGPRIGIGQREWRPLAWTRGRRRSIGGAGVTGVVFAIGWTPCIGPILGGILTFAAAGQSPWSGAALLLTYSAGLGAPFLATSLAFGQGLRVFPRVRRLGAALTPAAGLGLAAMGLLIATGQMAAITRELARFNQFG